MEIRTKYSVGQDVFFVSTRDNLARIYKEGIKKITIGGKDWELYSFRNTTRGERDVSITFDEAKKRAIEEQKKINKRNLKMVLDYTEKNT